MQSYQTALSAIYERELNKLKTEIQAYSNEQNIWLSGNGISNSAGNLTLHLLGNLNHFIGAVLGNTGYIRQRDLEFSTKNVPAAKLVTDIENIIVIIRNTLAKLDPAELEKPYPVVIMNDTDTTGFILVHLLTHFGYHLGQINYHRRLLDK